MVFFFKIHFSVPIEIRGREIVLLLDFFQKMIPIRLYYNKKRTSQVGF